MQLFAYNVLASLHNTSSSDRSASAIIPHTSTSGVALSRPKSTTALRTMATVENAPGLPQRQESDENVSRSASTSSRHPDLSNEVASLSDKLIHAINQQTSLDDKLAQTRQDLDTARARIAYLEGEARAKEQSISKGELMTRISTMNTKLTAELAEEKRQKSMVQQEKRGIESELENLTASLFDEANKMVASANKERDAVERRNQLLRDQIKDGERLLASQSEQLAELKVLMQSMSTEKSADDGGSPHASAAPDTPGFNREEQNIVRLLEAMNLSPTSPETGELSPAPSTSFTHLLKPLCRSDIPAYDDFRSLVQLSSRSHHPSRASSGNYRGLNVIGISSLHNDQNQTISATPQNGSTTSLNSASHSHSKSNSVSSPTLPGSFNPPPTPTTSEFATPARGPIPLKDTKFYKRILVEDVEPTLRLDLSPTLSWLNRRSILAALAESSLIVEPIPEASRKLYGKYTPCALCGEGRKESENPRTHRMRMNEGEAATKWALCVLCLEKVRGVGDLVGYVRMVRDGVVKCADKAEEGEAWEELIRLRERLFWARMAGGVVPSFMPTPVIKNAAGFGTLPEEDGEEIEGKSGFATPVGGGDDSGDEAQAQLQKGLEESLTTFDNCKDIDAKAFEVKQPTTPDRKGHAKRESLGGSPFPKINIPKMSIPEGFFKMEVNSLR